jgi:hypothetical protein
VVLPWQAASATAEIAPAASTASRCFLVTVMTTPFRGLLLPPLSPPVPLTRGLGSRVPGWGRDGPDATPRRPGQPSQSASVLAVCWR